MPDDLAGDLAGDDVAADAFADRGVVDGGVVDRGVVDGGTDDPVSGINRDLGVDPVSDIPPTCDVLIVGGGITGCATAYYLAQAGVDVVVCDEFDLNTMASGRNAGSLHGQMPHADFVARGEGWARSFLPAQRFLCDSLSIWEGLSAELKCDLEVSLSGGLLLADSAEQMSAIERKVELERTIGIDADVLDAAAVKRLAPWVSDRIIGAELCHREGKANPLLVAPAFAAAARRDGAQIFVNTTVAAIDNGRHGREVMTSRGPISAGQIVFASGNAANRHAPSWSVPPVAVIDEPIQATATEPCAPLIDHLVYYAGGRLTMKQARAGTILIGGGWPADPVDGGAPRINLASMSGNMAVATRVMPMLAGVRALRSWAGVVLRTPELMPIIGAVGDGMWLGLIPHFGLTGGPLLGQVLATAVLGRPPEFDLRPFDPALHPMPAGS